MTEPTPIYNVPRGTALLTSQQAIVYASSFVFYVLLFRILNLSEIGQISLLAAAMAIFNTLTQLALPVAATRFISSSLASQDSAAAAAIAKTTLRLTVIIAGPALLLASLLSPWIGDHVFKTTNATSLLVTTFTAAFLLDLTALYGAYFLGLGLYAQTVYQNIFYIPLSRGLGLLLAHLGLRVLGIALGWAVGSLATLLLSLYLWRGRLPRGSSYLVRPLLSFSLPVFASALITLGQGWGDIALLQTLLGQLQTTGAYFLVVSSVGFLSILWTPVAAALYPALSASYSSGGPAAVSKRLAPAFRLANLTVLPLAASLAAVAPTALEVVYGPQLVGEALPFTVLLLTVVFSAQGALLVTALQAIGNTRPLFKITLTATIIDLATVALTATTLGTTGGAIGRASLGISIVLLGWQSLRPTLHTPIGHSISKAIVLAAGTSIPLALADQLLIRIVQMEPILRLPALLAIFAGSLLVVSRRLSAFEDDDFALLENALPNPFHPILRILQRLFT